MEPAWLICVPVAEMEAEPAEGSVERLCAACGTPVWVARSSQLMLASGDPYQVMCTNCAMQLEEMRALHPEPEQECVRQTKLELIARMKAAAEAAYDKMYDLGDDQELKREFETACDSLQIAASLARELGLEAEAEAHEQRADRIRKVYRSQMMYPPDLLA
jgi:hypothetical protein